MTSAPDRKPDAARDANAGARGTARLELRRASKAFGRVRALSDGTLTLRSGEVHALLGENGAGKSTLVKILAGVYRPDSGELLIDGVERHFATPADARDAGIAVIYQEPTLFFDLSVAENIHMGRQPVDRFGRIDYDAMHREVGELLASLGVDLRPERRVRGLSIADQQVIEIAKALSLNANVLIMDEPTAALSGVEVERLFTVARSLRDEGRALMFISHRFDEVFDLCDTVTVMRDGTYIATSSLAETTVDDLVQQMVGREVDELFPKLEAEIGEVVLEVENLSSTGLFRDISFTLRRGEILGLAGLVGAGRSEVARAIFGVDGYESGSVKLNGRPLPGGKPAESINRGLALVPEDRRKQGLVLEQGVAKNIALSIRQKLSTGGLLTARAVTQAAREWASRLEVKASALDTVTGTLSGGNQQKVVLAKWLATNPDVLIVDEPTRGIDVGTKSEVHRLLSTLAQQGKAILMISSELPEVLGMADRVLVMREGRLTAQLSRAEATPESVMHAATAGVSLCFSSRLWRDFLQSFLGHCFWAEVGGWRCVSAS